MVEQTINKQWWEGLGIELETDIETFDNTSKKKFNFNIIL